MTQRSINLVAAAILAVGGVGLAIWATRPKLDDRPFGAATAPAKPEPRVHSAPFEIYARAAEGDWAAYHRDNGFPSGIVKVTVLRAITAAAPDHVTRTARGRIDGGTDEHDDREDFPRAGLTLERLDGEDIGGWTISDVSVAVAPYTVGDRTFKATKISFASADPMFPRKRTHTELWISDEVPAGGLVAYHEVQVLDANRFVFTEELIGFGDASGTTWGARPDGL